MKIAVCLKWIPATDALIRLAPGGAGLDFSFAEWVLNPCDAYALEAALRLRESRGGAAEVIALSVGGDEATAALRQALAVLADQAFLVRAPGVDAAGAAAAAAAVLGQLRPDLIFCGAEAADDGLGLFPAALAERLGWPHLAAVCAFALSADGRRALCRRRGDAGEETIEAPLPVVVSCARMPDELRVPTLKGRLESRKKPLTVRTPADAGVREADLVPAWRVLGYAEPPPRVPKQIITAAPREAAAELLRLLREERTREAGP